MFRAPPLVAAAALCVSAASVQAQAPNNSLLEGVPGSNGAEALTPGDRMNSDRETEKELPRRIIVATSANGRSHVAREDAIPQNEGPGIRLTNLWLAPATPVATANSELQGFIPFTMQQTREPLYAMTLVEYPVGTGQTDPGMHATATIDHFYVIEGEIVLVLEDGEASLRAGDVAVVHGALHGWRNDGTRPARLLFFVLPTR